MARVGKAFEAEEDLVLRYEDVMVSNSRAQHIRQKAGPTSALETCRTSEQGIGLRYGMEVHKIMLDKLRLSGGHREYAHCRALG